MNCNELAPDFFTQEPAYGVDNPLWGKVRPGTIALKHHEDVLRSGARHTVEELVDIVAAAHPVLDIDNKRVSTRLSDAKDSVARAHGIERATVKRQFDEAQARSGVKKRKDLLAARRRQAIKGVIDLSNSPEPSSADRAFTMPLKMAESGHAGAMPDGEDGEAAAVLVGLSQRAWNERTGVRECEEAMGDER